MWVGSCIEEHKINTELSILLNFHFKRKQQIHNALLFVTRCCAETNIMETERTILREEDRVSVSWTVSCNNHYVDSHYLSLINEMKSPVLKDLQYCKGIKKNNKNLA